MASSRPVETREARAATEHATIEIRKATPSDAPAINAALGRAFHDDPVFRWVVPDDDVRRQRLASVFGVFTDVYLPLGETYVVNGGAGAALWAPSGVEPFTEEQSEAFGQRMVELIGPDAERAGKLDQLLDEHHPEEPCLYLQFVGVVPDQQGQGIGSRMLTVVLERADASGTPAYLEATSPDNRRLYERHGFEVVGELPLPDGPSLWPMWRDSQPY